jgi:hypothetical protein
MAWPPGRGPSSLTQILFAAIAVASASSSAFELETVNELFWRAFKNSIIESPETADWSDDSRGMVWNGRARFEFCLNGCEIIENFSPLKFAIVSDVDSVRSSSIYFSVVRFAIEEEKCSWHLHNSVAWPILSHPKMHLRVLLCGFDVCQLS